ncbi:hypothetical protein [Jongsikchunia kroppenstedtii]|uniref:hypothetical protein n=1 Tax=Jongsikchunia kroppenstedtii TaxID=1121721 RepID=UPI000373D6DF|nr:hypothetical protein [Jongsikchunia kroppenstedtii]
MQVTRRGRKELALSEFPGWGVEVMMGLYGQQQVLDAIEAERAGRADVLVEARSSRLRLLRWRR